MEIPGVKVEGTFDVQKFFDALAMVLSQKMGVEITAKVKEETDIKPDRGPAGEKIA